jgi:hypothetical protein
VYPVKLIKQDFFDAARAMVEWLMSSRSPTVLQTRVYLEAEEIRVSDKLEGFFICHRDHYRWWEARLSSDENLYRITQFDAKIPGADLKREEHAHDEIVKRPFIPSGQSNFKFNEVCHYLGLAEKTLRDNKKLSVSRAHRWTHFSKWAKAADGP